MFAARKEEVINTNVDNGRTLFTFVVMAIPYLLMNIFDQCTLSYNYKFVNNYIYIVYLIAKYIIKSTKNDAFTFERVTGIPPSLFAGRAKSSLVLGQR